MSKRKNRKDLGEGDFGEFIITKGKKQFELEYKLNKGRLTIWDKDNNENRVSLDMRKGKIAIDRDGDVYFHRE